MSDLGLEVADLPLALAAAVAAVGLFFLIVHYERTDRSESVLSIIVLLVVVEMIVNGEQADVPVGVFRPAVGGFDFRLMDLIIPAAVAARVMARSDRPIRFSIPAIVWSAFFVWYLTGAFTGLALGNEQSLVLFDARAIVMVGGLAVLASGVRIERMFEAKRFGRFLMALAIVTGALTVLRLSGGTLEASLPGLSLPHLSLISADTVTVLVGVGALGFLCEVIRPVRRMRVLVACLVLVFLPFSQQQGASFFGLAVVLAVLVAGMVSSTWRERVSATPTELAAYGVGLVAIALAGVLATGDNFDVVDDIGANIDEALFSDLQARTSEIRLNQWSDSWELIVDRPVLGNGLGTRVTLVRPWPLEDVAVTPHNVVLDVATRVGLPGLAMFLAALGLTLAGAWRVWRSSPSDLRAAVALGCLALVAGILAKGMAESALEKLRLAAFLGLGVGFLQAAVRADEEAEADVDAPVEVEPVQV